MQIKLNNNHLKLIAIIAMTIDHGADLIFPGFTAAPMSIVMHLIGRLTAPIMWFFVCEGYHFTKDRKKYIMRLGIFSIISHFAYCFSFGIPPIPFSTGIFNQTSVMYPLFIAAFILWLDDNKTLQTRIWLKRIITFILIWSAFPADWSCIAVLSIIGMYKKRGDLKGQMKKMLPLIFLYGVVSYFFVSKVYAMVLIGVLFVYPVLKLYNGEKGKANWMKWFFYAYYPAHLIIIGIFRLVIYGNVSLLF